MQRNSPISLKLMFAWVPAVLCWCQIAFANSPSEELTPQSRAKIEALIAQLGDDDFDRRETAGASILKYGLAALPLVESGAKHADREIRYRCERLKLTLLDLDLQRRLEEFAADVKGERQHGLPAWDRFAKAHGDSSAARKLFVEVYKAEGELLKALEQDPRVAGELLAVRLSELQMEMRTQTVPKLGTIAAVLYAGTTPNVPPPGNNLEFMYSNLCYQQSFRDAIAEGSEKRDVLRSLLSAYIEKSEGNAIYQTLNLAVMYDIKAGLIPARKILGGAVAGHVQPQALMVIAKFGSADDLQKIEPLLENKQVVMTMTINGRKSTTQVRDAALVTTLHLLKVPLEGIKRFGFDRLEGNESQMFATHTIGFENDEQRDAAFKKWNEEKANLKTKAAEKAVPMK